MDIKTAYWQSDGNATNVILGFVPDLLEVYEDIQGGTGPLLYKWSRSIHAAGLTGMYGFTDASTGDWVACADANNGFIPFDESGNYVMVESPIPGIGKKAVVANDYETAHVWVARSATVIGSIIRPTVRNGYVYECTTYLAANGTPEPTWPTTPGATVTEAVSSNVFTCREEQVVRGGGKGFTMGATIQTNGQYVHFIAYKTDRDRYLGDAAEGDLSIV